MSIITNGLGSNATNLILGMVQLGFLEIIIEPESPIIPPSVTGGAGGDYPDIQPRHKITFVIRHKDSTWEKSYVVDQSRGLILIRVTKVATKVINTIMIQIKKITKKIGNIHINIWK